MNTRRRIIPALLLSPLVLLVLIVAAMVLSPLIVAGYLSACVLGGALLSHWSITNLRYGAFPPAVMGVTTAFLPPFACGFEPYMFDTVVMAAIFVLVAQHVFRAKSYAGQVRGLIGLLCGVAVGLQLQVGLCHADYPGEFDLLERWFRGGVWLAVLAAMATGWLSAWLGTQASRLLPAARV